MHSINRSFRFSPEQTTAPNIDFLVQRVKKLIVEFEDKKCDSSLPLVVVDKISDDLLKELERMHQEFTCYNYESLLPQLIETNFYSSLARLQVSEMNNQLFNHQTVLFKKLISSILTDNSRFSQYPNKISEILGVYLLNFVNHNNLLEYQIIYLNRLVLNILKICSKNPSIFHYWLDINSSNSNFTSYSTSKQLPLFSIIYNFLKYDKEYDQSGNLIKLMKLTHESPILNSWFYNHETLQEFFEGQFISLYNKALQSPQRCDPQIKDSLTGYLDMFNKIIEASSSQLSNLYIQCFEENFLNSILDGILNSTLVSFMFIVLTTFSNNKSCSILLDRILSSKNFTRFLERIIEIEYEVTTLLAILHELFLSHEFTILKTISGDQGFQAHNYPNVSHDSIRNIEMKTIAVLQDSINDIDMAMVNFVNYNMHSSSLYWFNSNMVFPKFYLSLFLDYFRNYPKLNVVLNEFSSTIFLKVNVLGNQKFKTIVDYLYVSYTKYLELVKQHEKYKYDTFEINKLRLNKYFTPRVNLLNQLEFENYQASEELIDFVNLQENLQLFKKFLIDLYINTKFKYIEYDHAMS
ncbi:hypothetical protein JA1_004217 [Spathaspora sp. JA1]|nr:hypothetical protein JA1_004217 [Spathaspora sp. JA1]